MTVTPAKLEESLSRVQSGVIDPRWGLFGPHSCQWLVAREAGVFLAAGRAALLQLAHPFVAHAVDQHSKTRSDPAGRFVRTFENVFPMIFGDLDDALRCARRVHQVHRGIAGRITERVGPFAEGAPYHANHEEALFWVAATLWDSALVAHELIFGPLPPSFKEAYYQESKRFAYLFGIPDRVIPPSFADFEVYCREQWGRAAVGATARSMGLFLLSPPRPLLAPAVRAYGAVTKWLLPAPVLEGYGLSLGNLERQAAERSVALLRGVYPGLPPRIRFLPAYRDAVRRVEQRPRGLAAEGVERGLRAAAERGLRELSRRP